MIFHIGIICLAVGGGVVLFKWLRSKFKSKVCCWFCNHKSFVPYEFRNSWDCLQCEQYNGFNKDGDYNKRIAAQYDEQLNTPCSDNREEFIGGHEHFCTRCSQNQLMKIKQLANFTPYSEANYDYELSAFKAHLEKVYKLCRDCEIRVQQELDIQNEALSKHLNNLDDSQRSLFENQLPAATEQTFLITKRMYMHILQHSSYVDRSVSWPVTLSVILHVISLACAILLIAKHVDLAGPSVWQKWLLTAHPLLFWLDKNAAIVAGMGISTAVMARLILGKDRLYVMDAISLPVWLLVLLPETGYFLLNTEPVYDMAGLVVNCLACVVCLCRNRELRNKPNISIIRHKFDSSVTSTDTSDDQVSPESSQTSAGQSSRSNTVGSTNKRSRTNYQLRLNSEQNEAPSVSVASNKGDQKLSGSRLYFDEQTDNDLDFAEGQSGTKVTKGQGDTILAESKASGGSSQDSMDDALLPDLNFVSLGTPSIRRSSSCGLFPTTSQSGTPPGSQTLGGGLPCCQPGQKRPLISPAAFKHRSAQHNGQGQTMSRSQSFSLFSPLAADSSAPISFTARSSTPVDWSSSTVDRTCPDDRSSPSLFQSHPSAFTRTMLPSAESYLLPPQRSVSPVMTSFGIAPFANVISNNDRLSQCSSYTLPNSFTVPRTRRSTSTVVARQRDSSVAGSLSRKPLFQPIRECETDFPADMNSDIEDDLTSVSRIERTNTPRHRVKLEAQETHSTGSFWGYVAAGVLGMVFGGSIMLNIITYT